VTKYLLAIVVVIGVSMPREAAAQASVTNVQIGYQFLHYSGIDGGDGASFPLGFALTGAVPVSGQWSGVADLTWGRHSEDTPFGDFHVSETTLTGGVRWTEMKNWWAAQLLLGLNHEGVSDCNDCGSNDFVFMPGILARRPLNSAWNVYGRFDYRHVFFEGEGVNGFALIVGVERPLK